ncbi:MAG: HAMP domain-containing protein, partial [Proteobacteria bacterium]|nr:HAMP domain-containing protein [Pseudomonadota bacterium]
MKLSLKYKFLSVLLAIVVAGLSTFFFFSRKTFSEDKKLFVLDWNLNNLKSTISEIKLELKGRMEELQILIPRVYQSAASGSLDDPQLYRGLSKRLSSEVFAITFLQKTGETYKINRYHENISLLKKYNLSSNDYKQVDRLKPLAQNVVPNEAGIQLLNRSVSFGTDSKKVSLPLLTIIVSSSFLNDQSQQTLIAIDMLQDFMTNNLRQSELAELFLISKSGFLISHPQLQPLFEFNNKKYNHPIVQKLETRTFPRESLELELGKESYLGNLGETGLGDAFAVSQIKKSDAFRALRTITQQTLLIGLPIIAIALAVSVIFAATLTQNIQKLEHAAREIGAGNLDVKVDIKSGDEVESVATTFQWMTVKIIALIKETAEKARMEEELATASLIQNTILTPPKLNIDSTEVVPYYKAASECGGDLWDAFVKDDKLTVILGDATGHGAPAAIVTAVVKSCVSTLNSFTAGKVLSPSEMLNRVNEIVYQSCKGELLMTMAVAQLDLKTGQLAVSNAGHESPFYVKGSQFSHLKSQNEQKKPKAEALFVRGERLGFSAETQYETLQLQMEAGDSVLLYSDGISEAHNKEGKAWGERALKNLFASIGNRTLEEIKLELVKSVETFM